MDLDVVKIAYAAISIFGVVMACFGWSHANLSKRIDKVAIDVVQRATDAELRILIKDHLAPYQVELTSLSKQIDMILRQYEELDKKIDSILYCIKERPYK